MSGLPLPVAFYGGSISADKEIVKSSSLIDLLEENDMIMADRGFDIQDLLACKKVKLFIPPKRQSKSGALSIRPKIPRFPVRN